MTFLAPSWLISLRDKAGILYLTNHWIFSPHFSCNDITCRIKSNAILISMIWCSGWSDPAHGCLKRRVHAAAD